jgi:hypothetical protein
MAALPRKLSLNWRIQGINAGVTKDEILDYFEASERERIVVQTLYPSVDDPAHELTATIKYTHDVPEHTPRLRDDVPEYLCIDRDFQGFTPLYSPAPDAHDADIVALTGLAGHAIESWTTTNNSMWLRDFLPADTPNARILTYGYAARLEGLATPILRDLAEEFLNRLIVMRHYLAQGDQRPLILIGHSLGGLIIKSALIQATELNLGLRLPVRLIIFLATPHRGMTSDALRTVIKDEPPKQLREELDPNSPLLRQLYLDFRKVSERIKILSVFETQKTATAIFDVSHRSRGVFLRATHSDSIDDVGLGSPTPIYSQRKGYDSRVIRLRSRLGREREIYCGSCKPLRDCQDDQVARIYLSRSPGDNPAEPDIYRPGQGRPRTE